MFCFFSFGYFWKIWKPGDSSRDLFDSPDGWEVTGHQPFKGSCHVNSPSQKGHQQNCQEGDFSLVKKCFLSENGQMTT